MATLNKNFKVKHGLVVEGTTGTIDGNDILTKAQADIDYILAEVGGSGVSTNTPDTLVLRDVNGDFAAGTITANSIAIPGAGTISEDGELLIAASEGEDIRLTADDVRVNAVDDFRVEVGGDILLETTGVGNNVYVGSISLGNEVVTELTLDNHIGDGTVDGTAGNTVTDRIATAKAEAIAAADSDISAHVDATSGVHGVTGDVVGTTDTQTLTNKTLGSGTNLSVNLDMNGNKIEDLATPTAGTDATTKNYVDEADTATLGSANSYTDGRETAITTAYQTYADQAETDAKAYTDTRETAITAAYQLYADTAEADAVSTAAAYTDQAELDAIASAATAAAALYAPLAGATFTGEVLLSADPTQALGAATKQYVDSVAEGLHIHASVVAATTSDVDLSTGGLLTVDGVTLNEGERVLVKSQTNATQNGIYVASSGAWTRAEDYDSAVEIQAGDFVFVSGGTLYNSTGWVQENVVSTLGTDQILWDQFSGAGEYTAGTGITLTGTSFAIDETYTATKSYVDGEISDLDTSLKAYADQAEVDAKAYTDTREAAITTAYEAYADQAESDANTHADGVALTAENNAKAYTDTRETAITTAYQNYADLAEADAKLYTDDEIAALTTDDIEEGVNNLYFTNQRAVDAVGGTIGDAIDALDTDDIEEGVSNLYFTDIRAKGSAADLIVNAIKTNITITGNEDGLTITAENGVADSTTSDLAEGTNLYFTDTRAKDAVASALGDGIEYQSGSFSVQIATGLVLGGGTGNEIEIDRETVDTWYDAAGSAAAAQAAAALDATSKADTAQSNAETFATNAINALTTDDIEEGSTNKYFDESLVFDAVSAQIVEGDNIDVTFDNVAKTATVALADDVVIPSTGSLNVESNDFNVGADSAGLRTSDGYVNPIAVFSMDADDDYAQVVIKNTGSGVNSSSDIQLYSNNGDDINGGWIDVGITSATFADVDFTITGANDGYIFMEAPAGTTGDGNLVLATGANGVTNAIVFAAGGLSSDNTQMTITPDESVRIVIDTPSTSPSTGALVVDGGVGIQGDVNIQGNITFGGEGTSLTTENLAVTDPLIYVGDQNASDAVDMGIVTEYNDGVSTKFAGLVRDASDGVFKVFSEATTKPTSTVDFAEAGLEYGDLKVDNIEAASANLTSITIGMVDETEIAHLNGVTSNIQDQLDDKLELAGGTMSGAIEMGSNKVTGLADPTDAQDAATKAYVDAQTTTDISEGTNLYFTDARAVEALEAVVPNFEEIDINSVATQVAAKTTGVTGLTTVYSFAKADYRSAKFLVKLAYGTHTEVSEVLVTLDTSDNIAMTEYAIVGTNGSLSTVSASISGTNVDLTVDTANSSTVTVVGTLLA